MKASSRKLLAVILALVAGLFAAGCAPEEAVMGKELTLGNIGWDENTVIANLTKILLEEDLDYDNVEIQQADVGPTFQGVATGDLDAFQDVWMPNHQEYMSEVEDRVEQLSVWYTDTTRFGLAAPTYMGITSIDQINDTDVDTITGIEPGAAITNYIDDQVIPWYDLDVTQQNQATAAMLAELDRLYQNQEPIIFPAWRPHWMNDDYDFVYLEDPLDALYPLNRESEVLTIVNIGLRDDHPDAYTLMDSIRLSEAQIVSIERDIEEGSSPEEAVRNWLENNRDTVQPWIDEAKAAQES
jgi:glycine betaine/proline transport system substrate-binding protein